MGTIQRVSSVNFSFDFSVFGTENGTLTQKKKKISHLVCLKYTPLCKTLLNLVPSDQPVQPPGMARVLVYPSLDIPEAVECTCDQRRLIRHRWLHKSYCRFCRALAHLSFRNQYTITRVFHRFKHSSVYSFGDTKN